MPDSFRQLLGFAGMRATLTRPGIGRRLALWVLAFSFTVTLIFTLLQLRIEYKRDVAGIVNTLDQIPRSYSNSLAKSLWVTSQKDAQMQLDGIIRLPGMQYLEIRSDQDKVVANAGKPQDKRMLRRETPLYYEYRGKQVYVGKLVAVADLEGVYRRLGGSLSIILLRQTAQTFLVSLFILFLFHQFLGRHLRMISRYSEQLLADSDGNPLKLERNDTHGAYRDELDQLVTAINRMRQRLAAAFQDLRESNARFRSIIEATPDPLALSDEQGSITYLNDAFVQALGYTIEDIPTVADWWHHACPDTQYRQWAAESWQKYIEEARRDGDFLFPSMELKTRCKDGSVRSFMISASTLQGDFSGTHLVMLYDVTERNRAEQEMRIAATAFETQEGMFVTDADGLILRVNHAFTGITGYAPEEVIGKNPRILSSGRQDGAFYAAMWASVNRKGGWEGEIWNRRKNGEIYPEHLIITAVKAPDGAITHYVASFADITLRKATEEEIKSLAFFDPLTQLPNRRLLLDRLRHALASSARGDREGALLFIDLDNFKTLKTPSVITSGICCCSRRRNACNPACAKVIRWRAWAATNSW